MKVKEIIKKIERKYPLSLAYDWDNVGLIVGDYDLEVKKILVSLEANEKVIDEAIDKNIDLIITHHPFIFSKMNKINTGDFKGRLIHKLIKNDISLYSMHTNFDIAFDGLNDYFMELMEFKNLKVLDTTFTETLYKLAVYTPTTHSDLVREAISNAGAGYIGNYSDCTFNIEGIGTFKPREGTNPFIGQKDLLEKVEEIKIETIVPNKILSKVIDAMIKAHPYEEVAYDLYKLENKGEKFGLGRIATLDDEISLKELCEKIKTKLNIDSLRVVGDLDSKINKVALVTGSGANLVKKAKSYNCDVLITGDVKYHDAQDALDMGMNVIDCGHFGSEDIFKNVMKRFLDEFDVVISDVNLNPFKTI
jgi:dinuclear metal center YbgI/SA1388 family protein